ncbi:MAG: PilN domain-containing protein, partial [Fimbriimonas sp.]
SSGSLWSQAQSLRLVMPGLFLCLVSAIIFIFEGKSAMLKADERSETMTLAKEPSESSLAKVNAELVSSDRSLALRPPAVPPQENNANSLLVCLGAVVAGLVMSAHYAKESHRLETLTQDLNSQSEKLKQKSYIPGTASSELRQYGILAARGVPAVALMDEITRALTPGVGLSSVAVNPAQRVSIKGEAASDVAMLKFLENVRAAKSMRGLRADGFTQSNPKQQGVQFALTGEAISMADVWVGGEK